MPSWSWEPAYRFTIKTPQGSFQLHRLMQIQGTLMVSGGVGQLSASFADPEACIRRGVNPQPMNVVVLELRNRWNQWGTAWTGYVDTVDHEVNPQAGDILTLSCSSPYKLWEITLQDESDAYFKFASSLVLNVSGTTLLEYTAQQVGYPTRMLRLDPFANSGSGIQSDAIQNAAYNPDLQSWGAALQGFIAGAGLEFFFDEEGKGIWRRVGFLGTPAKRPLLPDEIVSATLSTSDQGVYTDIEVRPQFGGVLGTDSDPGGKQMIGVWPDSGQTDAMRDHLGKRKLVVYAPWILSGSDTKGLKAPADYLAKILGLQAAAGVLHGQVTLIADPTIGVGSVILVPPLSQIPSPAVVDSRPLVNDAGSFYYVHSVTYSLAWGEQWVMTLGLSYGRSRKMAFPYMVGQDKKDLQVSYPVPDATMLAGNLQSGSLLTEQNLSNYTFVVAPPYGPDGKLIPGLNGGKALRDNEVAIDPSAFNEGKRIQILLPDGSPLRGPSGAGQEYTTVKGISGSLTIFVNRTSAPVVTIKDIGGDLIVTAPVTDNQGGVQDEAYTGGSPIADLLAYETGGPPFGGTSGIDNTPPSTSDPPAFPPGMVTSVPLRALAYAGTRSTSSYISGHAGPDGWDCSGLVAWSYAQVGVGVGTIFRPNGGGSYNTDGGPHGIYFYMKDLGAQDITVEQAKMGDLLFIQHKDAQGNIIDVIQGQHGFSHVAFALGNGWNYGANSDTASPNIGSSAIANFASEGAPFNLALDMSSLDLTAM